MNDGIFVTPNNKGQVVIPVQYRKQLGINPKTLLNLVIRGSSLVVQPVFAVPVVSDDNTAYLQLIKKIQGSWGGETAVEKKEVLARRKTELITTKKSKNVW